MENDFEIPNGLFARICDIIAESHRRMIANTMIAIKWDDALFLKHLLPNNDGGMFAARGLSAGIMADKFKQTGTWNHPAHFMVVVFHVLAEWYCVDDPMHGIKLQHAQREFLAWLLPNDQSGDWARRELGMQKTERRVES